MKGVERMLSTFSADDARYMQQRTEHERLKQAVVEAAKAWRDGNEYVLNRETKSLIAVVESLNTWEASHGIEQKDE